MPNLVMEYSDPVAERVNIQSLLEDLHQATLGCGLFEAGAVKSRAYACHHWLVGDEGEQGNFIHIEFSLLAGRTAEQKRELARTLIRILEQHASVITSLTVNIRDMDQACFMKVSC